MAHILLVWEQIFLVKLVRLCCGILNIHSYHVILLAFSFKENYNLHYWEYTVAACEFASCAKERWGQQL